MATRAFINPPGLRRVGTYSHVACARGGVTVYISGQIALDAEGKVIGAGDLRAQTTQVFENLRLALEGAGATFADVVKLTHYVKGLRPELRSIITEVRNRYVSQTNPPASTMVGTDALVMEELLIEVEAIAVLDEARALHLP